MTTGTTTETDRPHYARWQELRESPVWTPALKRFLKRANHMVLYFDAVPDAPSWHTDACFVTLRAVKEHRDGREESLEVKVAGTIGGGTKDETRIVKGTDYSWKQYSDEAHNVYRPRGGSWLLYLYPGQHTHPHTCLQAIPTNAQVHLRVRLDWHSTSDMAEAGLHGDVLIAEYTVGRPQSNTMKHGSFKLDEAIIPHNTARFGYRV